LAPPSTLEEEEEEEEGEEKEGEDLSLVRSCSH